jgi:glyoxylase I family protein
VTAARGPGIPGAEHVAFSVPDLDQATTCFCDLLGCESLYSHGPFRDPDGTWFEHNFGLHPRTEVTRAFLLRCGHGPTAAIAYLAEHDIEVLGGKRPGLDAESGEGSTFAHFHTPWGMLLELVSFPRAKTYMDGRERVLWQPHHPEL